MAGDLWGLQCAGGGYGGGGVGIEYLLTPAMSARQAFCVSAAEVLLLHFSQRFLFGAFAKQVKISKHTSFDYCRSYFPSGKLTP